MSPCFFVPFWIFFLSRKVVYYEAPMRSVPSTVVYYAASANIVFEKHVRWGKTFSLLSPPLPVQFLQPGKRKASFPVSRRVPQSQPRRSTGSIPSKGTSFSTRKLKGTSKGNVKERAIPRKKGKRSKSTKYNDKQRLLQPTNLTKE